MKRFFGGLRDAFIIFGFLWITALGAYTIFSTTFPTQGRATATSSMAVGACSPAQLPQELQASQD